MMTRHLLSRHHRRHHRRPPPHRRHPLPDHVSILPVRHPWFDSKRTIFSTALCIHPLPSHIPPRPPRRAHRPPRLIGQHALRDQRCRRRTRTIAPKEKATITLIATQVATAHPRVSTVVVMAIMVP